MQGRDCCMHLQSVGPATVGPATYEPLARRCTSAEDGGQTCGFCCSPAHSGRCHALPQKVARRVQQALHFCTRHPRFPLTACSSADRADAVIATVGGWLRRARVGAMLLLASVHRVLFVLPMEFAFKLWRVVHKWRDSAHWHQARCRIVYTTGFAVSFEQARNRVYAGLTEAEECEWEGPYASQRLTRSPRGTST